MNVGDRVRVVSAEVSCLIGIEGTVTHTAVLSPRYVRVRADYNGREFLFYPIELEVL